jgi:hypothetical protein
MEKIIKWKEQLENSITFKMIFLLLIINNKGQCLLNNKKYIYKILEINRDGCLCTSVCPYFQVHDDIINRWGSEDKDKRSTEYLTYAKKEFDKLSKQYPELVLEVLFKTEEYK